MAKLTAAQIYQYAMNAGFNEQTAIIATAVALAESGGNTNARLYNPPVEDSRGLWQINLLAHKQYASWNLYDPQQNALAAFQVSEGGKNFGPWSTYDPSSTHPNNNAAYRKFLAAAAGADVAGGGQSVIGALGSAAGDVGSGVVGGIKNLFGGITDTASAIIAIGKFFEHLTEDLFNVGWWKRLGIGATGVTMIAVGIRIIIQPEIGNMIGQAGGAAGTTGAARGSAAGAGESAGGVIGEAAETAAVA
jgi:hypothetical protein